MKKTTKKETEDPNNKDINKENNADGKNQNNNSDNDDINDNENKSDESSETRCKEEKTELLYKISELNDKYLRVYSDFDNYRKRTLKEKNDLSKFANAELITELLPVIDDFERALKSIQKNIATEPIITGIELIYNKLIKILELQGLKPIISIGEVFNTDFHEAITKIPTDKEDMRGKVFDEIQKGYELNGKVFRYAKVIVAE